MEIIRVTFLLLFLPLSTPFKFSKLKVSISTSYLLLTRRKLRTKVTVYSLHPRLPSTFQPDGSQLILSLSPTSFSLNSSTVIHPLHANTRVCTHFQSHDRCSCNSRKTVNNFRLKKVGSLMEQFRFEKNLLERFNDRILRNWNPGKKGKRREGRKFCKLEVNSGRKKGLRLRSRMFRKMKFGRNLGGMENSGILESRGSYLEGIPCSGIGGRPPPRNFLPGIPGATAAIRSRLKGPTRFTQGYANDIVRGSRYRPFEIFLPSSPFSSIDRFNCKEEIEKEWSNSFKDKRK